MGKEGQDANNSNFTLFTQTSSYGGEAPTNGEGGPGCQSPTSLSSQFLYEVVTASFTKASEEEASQDCLEHIKISAGRGFC